MAESGAAQKITNGLISIFGIKNTRTAVMLTGFIVGITMFYSVGFVILVPLVFTVATATGLFFDLNRTTHACSLIGLPMVFLPPHPAPSALSIMFEADLGKTLIYGIIVAIPAILIFGPFANSFYSKGGSQTTKGIYGF